MKAAIRRAIRRETIKAKIRLLCFRFHIIHSGRQIPNWALREFLRENSLR